MVKAADVNRDIEAIAKDTGTTVFSYEEVHNDKIDNVYHYDYELVIKRFAETHNISEQAAKRRLIKNGILRMLPNGEYEVDVGNTTRGGGGTNYKKARVMFSFRENDFHTKYHELAHSIQNKYKLFDPGFIKEYVEKEQEKYKDSSSGTVTPGEYMQYLKEMHAEAFAFSAMLLRAENEREFLKLLTKTYNKGVLRTAGSVFYGNSKREFLKLLTNTYNKGVLRTTGSIFYGNRKTDYEKNLKKFYSSKQITFEIVKQMSRLHKEQKLGAFFCNDGVIDAEKLSGFCMKILQEKAYSPHTLKSFFKNDIFSAHSEDEHGWRGDVLKSIILHPAAKIMFRLHEGSKKQRKHNALMHENLLSSQYEKEIAFADARVVYDDPELMALKEMQRLQTKLYLMPEELAQLISDNIPSILKHGITDMEISSQAESLLPMEKNLFKRLLTLPYRTKTKHTIEKEFASIAKLLANNAKNRYFCKLALSSNFDLQEKLPLMLEKKINNPRELIIEATPLEKKAVTRLLPQFVMDYFVKENNLSKNMYNEMIRILVENPEKLRSQETLEHLLSQQKFDRDLFGINKRKFAKNLKMMLDRAATSLYIMQDNELYRSKLHDLKKELIKPDILVIDGDSIIETPTEFIERAEEKPWMRKRNNATENHVEQTPLQKIAINFRGRNDSSR